MAGFEEDLPGVDGVLPDDVGGWGYGGDGVEEGHCHPHGEDGVFLSEALCSGYAVAAVRSDASSDHELGYAGDTCHQGKRDHFADFRGRCRHYV